MKNLDSLIPISFFIMALSVVGICAAAAIQAFLYDPACPERVFSLCYKEVTHLSECRKAVEIACYPDKDPQTDSKVRRIAQRPPPKEPK